ncbi:EF1a methyl transferase [Acrasis kona]|uniref:EF1a methyl transferase n=1 Tax=Acrasis kona TaxID=1008807 RepID=A0AAW2Z5K4_9EUKA
MKRNYSSQEYWDSRYTHEESYDWLHTYDDIKPFIESSKMEHQMRVLVPGCGNSELSNDLYNEGYTNITSIDYSSVVVDAMNKKYGHLKYEVGDVTNLSTYESGSFDLIIDKSTLDCLANVGEDTTVRYAEEMYRLLSNGGIFVVVSYSNFRSETLMRENTMWEVLSE